MTKSEKGRGKMTTPLKDEFEKAFNEEVSFGFCNQITVAVWAAKWMAEKMSSSSHSCKCQKACHLNRHLRIIRQMLKELS